MFTTLAIGGLGMPELILISFLAMLFFGANRLPSLAEGLGQAIGKFRRSVKLSEEELNESLTNTKTKENVIESSQSETKEKENNPVSV